MIGTQVAAALELNERHKVKLASDPTASEAILAAMAQDPSVTVRAALAINPAATGQLLHRMIGDPDERVRALLAHRLALLLPGLPHAQMAPLESLAMSALTTLVADEALRVRMAIAEVLKEMPHAPRALILQLAHDPCVAVSDPIIRLSPLLNADDLLALVAEPVGPTTLISVARRPYLAARVADRIAADGDVDAITALLGNQTSAISEAALDRLIASAVDQPKWQVGLARRPHLSEAASRALAEFAVHDALADLALRVDLPPALARDIASRLASKLAEQAVRQPPLSPRPPSLDEAVALAQKMVQAGELNEEALVAAARRGEVRMCIAMLAVAGCVAAVVVERASTLRSTKGLVSLIWRAGMSMACAGTLQSLLLRLPPEAVMPANATGGFSLTPEEMHWQVDFLVRIGAALVTNVPNQAPDTPAMRQMGPIKAE